MAELTDLMKRLEAERAEIRRQVEAGEICACCLSSRSVCDGELKEWRIQISTKAAYIIRDACSNYAERIQKVEDLKHAGVTQDCVESLQRVSGIPEKFKQATFDQYRRTSGNENAYRSCMNFATNYPTAKNVCLLGASGVGKTMLGCAALIQIINLKAIESRYIYVPDLFDSLRESFGFLGSETSDLHRLRVKELCRIPCIFLDDPGVSKDSEWTESVYTQIIDGRYRNQKATILASNLDEDRLAEVIGERSMSRLVETYDIIAIKGEDWRLFDGDSRDRQR